MVYLLSCRVGENHLKLLHKFILYYVLLPDKIISIYWSFLPNSNLQQFSPENLFLPLNPTYEYFCIKESENICCMIRRTVSGMVSPTDLDKIIA